MLYDVFNYSNQIIGRVEASDAVEAWSEAGKRFENILDVRLVEMDSINGELINNSFKDFPKSYSMQPGPVFEGIEVIDIVDIESRDRFIWQISPDKITAFYFYTPYDAGAALASATAWRVKNIKDISFKYYNGKVEMFPFYLGDKTITMYWGDRETGFIGNLTDSDKSIFEAGFFTILREFLGEPRTKFY